MPVNAIPDLTTIPQTEACKRFILVNITAPTAPKSGERPAVNLSLVLDRSGSMDGDKMRNAIAAAKSAIDRLTDRDRFSVVTFDDHIDILVPSTPATTRARKQACRLVDKICARGTTDLSTGWLTGCEEVAKHMTPDSVSRVLLLTDGQANRGIQSIDELRQHAAELQARGIATTTFGLGTDFNEMLLRKMAEAGGGNFYFIETPRHIEDCITSETGEALEVTARNASLVIRLPEGVQVRCRTGQTTHETDGALHVSLGSLVSEQETTLVLEARIAPGSEPCVLLMRMADTDGRMADDTAQVDLPRSAEPAGRPNPDVVKALVIAIADKGRLKAIEASHPGNFREARRHLQGAIDRITPYAEVVAEAAELIAQLRTEAERLADMSEYDRKKMYSSSLQRSLSRREGGYSRRRARTDVGFVCTSPTSLGATDAAAWMCHTLLDRALLVERASGFREEPDASAEHDWALRISDKFHHVALRIAVIDAPLHDGWYSHWHADANTAVVSIHGVPEHLLAVYLASQVMLHGLRLLSNMYDPAMLGHAEARGCLFDPRANPTDSVAWLQALHVCSSCADGLDACGIVPTAVREACAEVRHLCAGTPRS